MFYINTQGFSEEFYVCEVGYDNVITTDIVPPTSRNHYIIHYITKGKGTFCGKELGPGEGFVICPGELCSYWYDKNDPWEYFWVGLSGYRVPDMLKELKFHSLHTVFHYDFVNIVMDTARFLFGDIESCRWSVPINHKADITLLLNACFQLLYSYHYYGCNSPQSQNSAALTGRQKYVQAAIEYMHKNYADKLSVSGIASQLHISDRYFYNIFKEQTGFSPKQYLTSYRIHLSTELMKNAEINLGEIAAAVGYSDFSLFSRMFKQIKQTSPGEYRRNLCHPQTK